MENKIKFKILFYIIIQFYYYNFNSQNNNFEKYGIFEDIELSKEFFEINRINLIKELVDNEIAVIFSNAQDKKSNDIYFDYHQNPNFYYFTGINQKNFIIILSKKIIELKGIKSNIFIFTNKRDKNNELWNGKTLGIDGAKTYLDVNYVFDIEDLRHININKYKILIDVENTYYYEGNMKKYAKIFTERSSINNNEKLKLIIAQLRQNKSEEEIKLLNKAINITCVSIDSLMRNITQTDKEYQAQAYIEFYIKYYGAQKTAFNSIIGNESNSCVLHYIDNRKEFTKNSLLVVDVGAEYKNYCADITRTIPINGKFSEQQKIIYNIVLEAQKLAIDSCVEGADFYRCNIITREFINEKLIELGIMNSENETKIYYPHGCSHYLGLDVHDVGTYGKLQNGQVITIEPGIYIPDNSNCDQKWWNIGVRIEDDILINGNNPIVLSNCVPKEINDIELIINKH